MKPFQYVEPRDLADAIKPDGNSDSMWLAGGTTLIDLMKLNVLTPSKVIAIKPLLESTIQQQDGQLVIGAGCTMAQVADHELIRSQMPLIRHSLILAASPQIRNMATMGGNLLQRTRWPYYRHVDFTGSGEDILPANLDSAQSDGTDISSMAILGHSGGLCGTYPGDFANALLALDGKLQLDGPAGKRIVAAREFYTAPRGKNSQYITQLKDHELIAAVSIPITKSSAHSLYLKVRERSSYAFALASAAVGLELQGRGNQAKIIEASVGLGGLATIPWASPEAEQALRGRQATDAVFEEAADAALKAAKPPEGLEWKVKLAKRVLVRALRQLRDIGVPSDEQLWAFQHGRA